MLSVVKQRVHATVVPNFRLIPNADGRSYFALYPGTRERDPGGVRAAACWAVLRLNALRPIQRKAPSTRSTADTIRAGSSRGIVCVVLFAITRVPWGDARTHSLRTRSR